MKHLIARVAVAAALVGAAMVVNATQAGASTYTAAPIIVSPDRAVVAVGQPVAVGSFAVGSPEPSVSVTADGALPAGISSYVDGIAGTPLEGSEGTYTFTVVASNGVVPDAVQHWTLVVGPPLSGPPPSVIAITLDLNVASGVPAAQTGTVVDPSDSPGLTFSLLSGPEQGTVQLSPDGSFVYHPRTQLVFGDGVPLTLDSFNYLACFANTTDCTMQSYSFLIEDDAHAVDDAYTNSRGAVLAVPVSAGVLANDVPTWSQPLTATLVHSPAHGTLSLAPDGSFTYTPATGFSGVDTFTYTADESDGAGDVFASQPATVSITVTACKPGNGFGDHNHCHSGPPGRSVLAGRQVAEEADDAT